MDYELIQASRRLSELDIVLDINGCTIDVHWFRVMKKSGSWQIPRHSHSSFEFHFLAHGCCTVQTDTDSFSIGEGSFYLTAPGVHHAQYSAQSDCVVEYSLDCEFRCRRDAASSEISSLHEFFHHAPCRPFRDTHGVIPLFEQALSEAYWRKPGYGTVVRSLVPAILVSAARSMDYGSDASGNPQRADNGNARMELIASFVQDNIHRAISPADIALFMDLSEKQIARIVFASEGYPTKKFITVSKIEEAKKLLSDTDMSISEIAGSLAFSNVSYFTNVFTKNEGVSPGNFRASERGLLHDHHTTMSKNCK